MDVIERQAAIDAGKELCKTCDEQPNGWCGSCRMDECLKAIEELPPAQLGTDKNVGTKISREPLELARAIDGFAEWQKHVQTDSNIDRDITIAIEALKAQLCTNLAEVGTNLAEVGTATYYLLHSPKPQPTTMTDRRSKGGFTMWYECDNCGEPVDQSDNYCPNCGRKFRKDG